MTDTAESNPSPGDETGRIDAAMLDRHLTDLTAPVYYCVGPAPMIASTKEMLTQMGIPKENMRFEQFAGY